MKQNAICLLKGLLFSTVILTIATLLLALLMMKAGWGDAVMYPMFLICFCFAAFIGGRYFARHAPSKRFIWGILFGAAFFALYLIVTYVLPGSESLLSENAMTFLLAAVGSGCVGGMFS